MVLEDPSKKILHEDADLLAGDPTAQEFLRRAKARALDSRMTPKRLQALNETITLVYERLLQLEPNTLAAMGFQKPALPTDGPLKAMDHGELRKRLDAVEPIKKADGSIDEVLTATKMAQQLGRTVVEGPLQHHDRSLRKLTTR
jgi:hypothetical protein